MRHERAHDRWERIFHKCRAARQGAEQIRNIFNPNDLQSPKANFRAPAHNPHCPDFHAPAHDPVFPDFRAPAHDPLFPNFHAMTDAEFEAWWREDDARRANARSASQPTTPPMSPDSRITPPQQPSAPANNAAPATTATPADTTIPANPTDLVAPSTLAATADAVPTTQADTTAPAAPAIPANTTAPVAPTAPADSAQPPKVNATSPINESILINPNPPAPADQPQQNAPGECPNPRPYNHKTSFTTPSPATRYKPKKQISAPPVMKIPFRAS